MASAVTETTSVEGTKHACQAAGPDVRVLESAVEEAD